MSKESMVVTGSKTRWSYVRVFEPKVNDEGKSEFTISLIIPKSSTRTIEKIKAAIQAAYADGESKLAGNSKTAPPLASIRTPLRDGDLDKPDDPAYKDAYFINAKCWNNPPKVVDANMNVIIDKTEVYSGCYGRAHIEFYAYNNKAKGIGCLLHGLQKIADGEPLGGHVNVEAAFAEAEDDDMDDFLR